jgi:hypothetical protein
MMTLIEQTALRGLLYCRGCKSQELFSIFNFGNLPIANELWEKSDQSRFTFPLHLRLCQTCGLGQVQEVVNPSRLFQDYRYLSSVSLSFVEHARKFALDTYNSLEIKENDWVLEIASNDGYLLQHYLDLGVEVLGIEPATNVAEQAISKGIPTINKFFGLQTASELLNERGFPRLIIANNVMAHVPDLSDFLAGLSLLAGPETLISIENPTMINFLKGNQFDTIYHEHYSYLTAHSVNYISKLNGLELFKVEMITTHGGSNRYWLRNSKIKHQSIADPSVNSTIRQEIQDGLLDQISWQKFSMEVSTTLKDFYKWLENSFTKGNRVVGYGAAAKASTLLNASNIEKSWLKAIADESHEKIGRFMPIQGIPIVSPVDLYLLQPTDIVIFPWNIGEELIGKIKNDCPYPVRIWRAIPTIEQIS